MDRSPSSCCSRWAGDGRCGWLSRTLSRIGTSSVALLILSSAVMAQSITPLAITPTMKLDLPVADVMLIVQTLGQIACPTVQAMVTCNKAAALVVEIQRQAKAQGN